jgi:8-oxo-dGTP diphosphatase
MTTVRVGVCVLVQDPLQPHKIFAGIRGPSCSHGANLLALPGGHLEMFETFEDCARREVREEMGIELDPTSLQLVHISNDIFRQENKHYVTIAMMAKLSPCTSEMNQRPLNCEPDKCLGWESYSWDELNEIEKGNIQDISLFPSLQAIVKAQPTMITTLLTSRSL